MGLLFIKRIRMLKKIIIVMNSMNMKKRMKIMIIMIEIEWNKGSHIP